MYARYILISLKQAYKIMCFTDINQDRVSSTTQVKLAFLQGKLEYTSAVWDPNTQKDISNIECVQKHGLENCNQRLECKL